MSAGFSFNPTWADFGKTITRSVHNVGLTPERGCHLKAIQLHTVFPGVQQRSCSKNRAVLGTNKKALSICASTWSSGQESVSPSQSLPSKISSGEPWRLCAACLHPAASPSSPLWEERHVDGNLARPLEWVAEKDAIHICCNYFLIMQKKGRSGTEWKLRAQLLMRGVTVKALSQATVTGWKQSCK